MSPDPYKYFRVEAREILDQLGKGVLDLEKGAPAAEQVPRLLRLAHTIKGAARVVKQPEVADLAHAIESVLTPFREGATAPPAERIGEVLKLIDTMNEGVARLGLPADARGRPAEPRSVPEQSLRTLRADIDEMDALVDGVAEVHIQLASLRRSFETLGGIRHLHQLLVDQLRSPRVLRTQGSSDKTIAIADELGGLLTGLEQNAGRGIEQVDREVRQVREAAERLRLLPVGLMFNVLERAARDAAENVGRRVSFETRGGDVRLDAQVLGLIQNALLQVVRNAVAHGIESETERAASGKPPEGTVALLVVRRGSRVSFVCRDDGRGVDLEAVRRALQRKGAASGEIQKLGPSELMRLLLEGGISTSGTVTEVSGRGIGLDLVRETVSRLGGELKLSSEDRRGATIEIIVPVSLASFDGLLVETNAQLLVVPLEAVRRTLRIAAADVASTAEGQSIVEAGDVIPFVPLARLLGASVIAPRAAWSAVVIESGGMSAAVGVDRLRGTENVLVRPIPRLAGAEPIVGGASFDAEGNPRIVVDPEALVSEARRPFHAIQEKAAERRPILVVDDSLTTRMLEQSILESAGYDVDVAVSGEDGLAKARQRRYALVLVDVEMPGMDGFEFISSIRADPDLMNLPAILVTSRNAPDDRQRGAEVGARGYIVKGDFDQTDLLDRIHKLTG